MNWKDRIYKSLTETDAKAPRGERLFSTRKKRSADASTERPPESEISDIQARVNKYFEENPEAEGAAEHKAKGSQWKDRPRGKKRGNK